jgi:hypothetical protein
MEFLQILLLQLNMNGLKSMNSCTKYQLFRVVLLKMYYLPITVKTTVYANQQSTAAVRQDKRYHRG